MTPRERFLAALRRQPVDRVPLFDFLFQKPLYTELLGRTPDAYNAQDALALTRALGLDGVWIPYGCFSGWSPERLSQHVYKDEWGTTFEQNFASWPIDAPIAYPLAGNADLDRYVPPDPLSAGRLTDIDAAVEINASLGDDGVAILGGVAGPLTLAWMLTGYENICLKLYDDPDFVQRLAEMAAEFGVPAIDRMAAAGVDAMIVSEDLGSSSGPLLGPAQYRKVFKPALGALVKRAKAHGLPVVMHSCGQIWEFLDDAVELGIDAVHALQRTAGMDLARFKEGWGDHLAMLGNIDSSRTLPYGSCLDVEREVKQAIDVAAPGYGYILGSDHSLHDGISLANIQCMFDTARRHGVYA